MNLQIAPTVFAPPIANAVTHGTPSSISFDATNTKAGTNLRQLELRLPSGYTAAGGLGPPGWTVTRVSSSGNWSVRFRVADCSQAGVGAGSTGTFRLDVTPPSGALGGDRTDALSKITASDPCGGPTGWSVTAPSAVTFQRKVLLVTGAATPAQGPPPVAGSVTWTVTNLSSAAQAGVTVGPAVTPATGWTGGACAPASLSLAAAGAAGSSGTVTCGYGLSTPQTYAFASSASGTGVSAVGASAGTIQVGDATASFALDLLIAGPGDLVHATLTVRNNTASSITVTPPTYAGLTLQNLVRATGTTDPVAAAVAAGASRDFVYSFNVSGVVGASFLAQGAASTTAGATNVAATPAGTVSASAVDWSPPAIVKARTAAPYLFTVTVTNGSAAAVSEVDIINPQPTTWTGLANQGTSSPLAYKNKTSGGGVDTLRYTGTLASGGTATIHFQFTAVPTVAQTTSYPFQVKVIPSGGGAYSTTYNETAAVAIPIPDVAQLGILSNAGGQVLAWVNTERSDAPHDGVVVFRTPAPGVPTVPADFVDYGVPASQPADFFYADRDGSGTASLADPAVGAFNYRVCNHDALLVYSGCTSGYWNGAGWLDSAVAPVGGWTHQLGGQVLLLPGVVPGNRVGVATNRPSLAVLDLPTGNRTFDPISLAALPSSSTPAAQLANGRLVLFAADNAGVITALDLDAGTVYWQSSKAGEAFVAGVSGIIRQYAAAAYQAAYPGDILLVASTTGRVLAVDATTGATLWTVSTGAPSGVRASALYDAGTNRIFVATSGGGVLAYDVGTSSPSTPPSPVPGWSNPGGTYRLSCTRGTVATDLACVDSSGVLRVLDKATGAVKASLATGLTSPSTLWPVGGGSPGFVVSSASSVLRVAAAGSPLALSAAGQWTPPGLTLSPVQVFVSQGSIVMGASDKKLHKLRLSDAVDTGLTAAITPQPASVLVGPPAYDVVNDLFVLGTDDGRLWAVKAF